MNTPTLSPQAQARIDAYLDAVERALTQSGHTREQRQAITDDLAGQIRDMLATQAPASPTPADVDAVLAKLDPPAAYGQSTPTAPGAPAPSTPLLASSNFRTAYLTQLIVAFFCCLPPLVMLVYTVPRITAIFRDFGTALPPLTRWIVVASLFVRGNFCLLLPVLVLVLLALPLPVAALLARTERRRMIRALVWVDLAYFLLSLLVSAVVFLAPILAISQMAEAFR